MKFSIYFFAFMILSPAAFSQQAQEDTIRGIPEVLDEVLVKAVRVTADSPVTHSNLTEKELEKRNMGQDLPFMLNFLPSVVSTSDAGAGIGYTSFRVRGSDATRVNVTLNGIPYNDAESQGSFFVNLPDFTSSVQNLQLQRGVGTSTNGSGAFGASLNLLTDAISEKPYGEIANSIGSFNTLRHNVKLSSGLLNNHIEIAGRLSAISSNGYIDRASSDLKSYFLQGSYVDDNTLIKAITFGGHEITYQAWNGIDQETLEVNRTFNSAGMFTDNAGKVGFYDNEVDDYQQDHYQLHWNQRFSNQWSSNLGLNYTYGRGFFEQYKEDENFSLYGLEPLEQPSGTINKTDLIRRRWLDNDYYVINANVSYKNHELELTSGAFFSQYNGDHFGEVIWARHASNSEIGDRYYFSDASKQEYTIFSKITYRINDKWQVFGDLQGRFINYKTGGITSDIIPIDVDQSFNFFNPKAGISYQLNTSNQLFVYYGRAHREPTRNDFEEGIQSPEKLNDYEFGWRYSSEKIKLNTNVFYMDYEDQLVLSGELNDVGAPLRTTSGSSYRLGFEIDAEILLGERLSLRPNLGLSSNKNRDFTATINGSIESLGDTNISFSPEVVISNMFLFQAYKNLQVGLLSKYVGEQFMGNIDSRTSLLDSYFVNDLNIYYELSEVPVFKSVLFSALINNILDIKYESNGYFYTYEDDYSQPGTITTIEGVGYYPQAGINFLAGVILKF